MKDDSAYTWGSTGEQETIIKPDHQFAFHLGYERFLNENNSLTIKGGRSFRYPKLMKELALDQYQPLTILDFHLKILRPRIWSQIFRR